MSTISILANTVRPYVNRRSNDTGFGAGTFPWQDPVHSWKAGPGEIITVENLFYYYQTHCIRLPGWEYAKNVADLFIS
jgi:hypothetical protein